MPIHTSTLVAVLLASKHALVLLLALSVATGFVMIVFFGYVSDQKRVRWAKDQLRAQLLAVRLFQDQPQVVLRAYGRILAGTGRYLSVAFKPLALVIIPLLLLMMQFDRYLGAVPFRPDEPILLKVQLDKPDALGNVSLRLPPGISESAPPVHIPGDNEVDWRLVANSDGNYSVDVVAGDRQLPKQVIVSDNLARLSDCRLRGHFWRRLVECGEQALPANTPVEMIAVNYNSRDIDLGFFQTNWLVVYFVVSLAAALVFKFILRIEI